MKFALLEYMDHNTYQESYAVDSGQEIVVQIRIRLENPFHHVGF
jgi:hypothetical protein